MHTINTSSCALVDGTPPDPVPAHTTSLIPDLQRTHVRCELGFEAPRLSLEEQKARAKAEALDADVAASMLEAPNDGTADYVVGSFSDSERTYRVGVVEISADQSRGGDFSAIASCSCPQYALHEIRCKHMFLVSRIAGYPFKTTPLDTRSLLQPSSTPSGAAVDDAAASAAQLLAQKQAQSERIIRELRTAASYAQQLHTADMAFIGRGDLQRVETLATRLRREVCAVTLKQRPYDFTMY
jgi:hypothetical protein